MSFFDGLTPTYTFQLRIERSDRIILDTTLVAKDTADEVAKAKKIVQRLLNEYTPVIQAPAPASTPEPEQGHTHPEAQEEPTQATDAEPPEEEHAETTAPPQSAAPDSKHPPAGVKGLLKLRCKECGSIFGTFLREYQTEVECRCGHPIDLTAPLAKYRFICPYCEKESWGQTNLEDPEITIRCKCGRDIDLRWSPKAREYQN